MQVKIATFNIHHGRGRDGRIDLARTAAAIAATEADLVALQELDRGRERSGRVDQIAELERLTEMRIHFAPTVASSKGKYGIALAARRPFDASFVALPRLGHSEPRGCLVANWEGITVLGTHLGKADPERRLQTERLVELAGGSPTVIAGDLNQSRRSLAPLVAAGFDAGPPRTTIPPWWLPRQIDYVLVGPGLQLLSLATVATEASDHRPLVATARLL
ncbi:MAG: endonuclease/exonuclease/phosphatase family protein [Actinomycetota bacterium]